MISENLLCYGNTGLLRLAGNIVIGFGVFFEGGHMLQQHRVISQYSMISSRGVRQLKGAVIALKREAISSGSHSAGP